MDDKSRKINKVVYFPIDRYPASFSHLKTSPGHFFMSYLNGLAGLSPKLAPTELSSHNETVGYRKSAFVSIGLGSPVNFVILYQIK
jgi:hypothetical protein